ncbi:hypothetical protein BJY26_003417 [Spelaeicoccus albus]|uniref:RES domain-containing protein n=1 Tax=Spelaeicoccus albus TaxID=1280376 RepID=A0A7Z0IJ66_9MICO|nr:hypothetical protein [Spelaeicoccus albus]
MIEVLAQFRPDPVALSVLDEIEVDAQDAELYPSGRPGHVPYAWCEARLIGKATLVGNFCDVTNSRTLAALRPHFLSVAESLGIDDFDGAAVRIAQPRELTQRIAVALYTLTDVNGVYYNSRWGDDLHLWAIFEGPGDSSISPLLTNVEQTSVTPDLPEIREAFNCLGLEWSGP